MLRGLVLKNGFLKWGLLVFLLFDCLPVQAEFSVSCDGLFSSQSIATSQVVASNEISASEALLNSFRELPSYWQRSGTVKLFHRYWNETAVIQLASEVEKLPQKNDCMIISEQTEVCFSATLSDDGKMLSISVPKISVGQGVSLGFRPKSLNMEFLKIISGILRGVESVKESHRSLETVEIFGLTTVNPVLATMLGRLGFEATRPPSLEGGADYRIQLDFL